jgi:hypothetical protein
LLPGPDGKAAGLIPGARDESVVQKANDGDHPSVFVPRPGPTSVIVGFTTDSRGLFQTSGYDAANIRGLAGNRFNGAYPATTPYSPNDLGATVYHILGVDSTSEVHDCQDPPVQLNRGKVMEALFMGAAG